RHAHDPAGAGKFVGYQDRVARLDDLKRMRHVCRAGHTRQVALDLGVERQPVVGVLLLLLRGPRLVRDVVAFDHTGAGRDAERGAKRDQRTEFACPSARSAATLVRRFLNNMSIAYATDTVSSLYFQRNTTGASLTSCR